MAYKIIDIQGIGEAYAPKLIAIGIKTPDELLEACLTPAARKKVADKTGISGKLILKWANHADLFRISGIGPQYAELLEAAGVDTVKELRHRVPANLTAKMVEINKAKNQSHFAVFRLRRHGFGLYWWLRISWKTIYQDPV